jgi:hypothetical protein
MRTNYSKIVTTVLSVIVLTSCVSSKKVSSGYIADQTKPNTEAQASAVNRGLKMQKEECEELALENVSNLRESGNGVSSKESFATNLALLDARSKLAQQLEVLVNGLIRKFNQQHDKGKNNALVGKASEVQQGYFNQLLTNTRPICKNTYVKEDGSYNVYVCVEMNEQQQKAMYKKLSDDEKIQIDFAEHQFLKELSAAKEEYRQKKLEQE